MSNALDGAGSVWPVVLERFERPAPAGVMARMVLEHALPAGWVDAVFEAHRQKQYSRELLFSTVVELTTLVSLGLRPSLHAAARQMPTLPVSLGSLYDKVNHTEPAVLRALVRGSAGRLAPVMAALGTGASLPGWRVRVLDGNHLPASEKRLAPLRGFRGAALPGQSLVVYDPESGLVTDLVACEDAHASERAAVEPLLDSAQPGELWIAERHFCTRTVLQAWQAAGASFIVREHGGHPRLVGHGAWHERGRTETGQIRDRRSKSRTSKRLGGASSSRWMRPPRTARPRSGCGATCPRRAVPGRSPRCIARAGASRACSGGWKACCTARWPVSATPARRCWASRSRCWPTTFSPCCNAAWRGRISASTSRRQRCPPTIWRCKSETASRACSSPCRPKPGRPGTRPTPAAWSNDCSAWHATSTRAIAQRSAGGKHGGAVPVATSKRKPKPKAPKGYADAKTARAHVATARVLAQASTRP